MTHPILQGAGFALALAAPAALIGQALTSADVIDAESAWLAPFVLVVVVAFGVGGWAAGRASEGAAMRDGVAAALLAFAVLQVVAVGRTLLAGDDVAWAQFAFNALLAASCGALGAAVAVRRSEVATKS